MNERNVLADNRNRVVPLCGRLAKPVCMGNCYVLILVDNENKFFITKVTKEKVLDYL